MDNPFRLIGEHIDSNGRLIGRTPFYIRAAPTVQIGPLKTKIKEKLDPYFNELEFRFSDPLVDSSVQLWRLHVPSPILSKSSSLDHVLEAFKDGKQSFVAAEMLDQDAVSSYFQTEPLDKHLHLIFVSSASISPPLTSSGHYFESDILIVIASSTSPRGELVDLLYKRMRQHKFIQVRSPFGTGKRTLLYLLQRYIEFGEPNAEVFTIFCPYEISAEESYQDRLVRMIRKENASFNEHPLESKRRTYLLFYFAERTYGDHALWSNFFHNLPTSYYVVLFSTGGRPPGSNGIVAGGGVFDKNYEKQLLLWPTPDTPHGLFLTRDECDDFLWRCSLISEPYFLRLTPDLSKMIFNWTGDHIFALSHLLQRNFIAIGALQTRGEPLTLETFETKDHLLESAMGFQYFSRGGFLFDEITLDFAEVLRPLLRDGYILQDEYTKDALKAYDSESIVYLTNLEINGLDHAAYVLASPMHASFLSWLLPRTRELPYHIFRQRDLIIEIIRCFKPSRIKTPLHRPALSGHQVITQASEIQFLDEFYRALHECTFGNVRVTPDFMAGAGATDIIGYSDFLITNSAWAIKLIRDGRRLDEHMKRLTQDTVDRMAWQRVWSGINPAVGRDSNHTWAHIVLNYCTTLPSRPHPDSIEHLFYAVFEQGQNIISFHDRELVCMGIVDLSTGLVVVNE